MQDEEKNMNDPQQAWFSASRYKDMLDKRVENLMTAIVLNQSGAPVLATAITTGKNTSEQIAKKFPDYQKVAETPKEGRTDPRYGLTYLVKMGGEITLAGKDYASKMGVPATYDALAFLVENRTMIEAASREKTLTEIFKTGGNDTQSAKALWIPPQPQSKPPQGNEFN